MSCPASRAATACAHWPGRMVRPGGFATYRIAVRNTEGSVLPEACIARASTNAESYAFSDRITGSEPNRAAKAARNRSYASMPVAVEDRVGARPMNPVVFTPADRSWSIVTWSSMPSVKIQCVGQAAWFDHQLFRMIVPSYG